MDTEIAGGCPALGRDIARAVAGLSKQAGVALAAVDLSLSQYRVLSFLEDGSSESAVLARRLAVRPPSVTSVMDGLVQRGLVERHQSADDRRRVRHMLTERGQEVLQAADQAVDERLGTIAACLEDAELSDAALGGLVLWRRAIRAYASAARRP